MISTDYNFGIEIISPGGELLGQVLISKDKWKGAVEYAQFSGIQSGQLAATNTTASASIEPVWDKQGEPRVASARITVFGDGDNSSSKEVSAAYFDLDAKKYHQAYLNQLNPQTTTEVAETFTYRLTAHRKPEEVDSRGRGGRRRMRVKPVVEPLALREMPVKGFIDRSVVIDQGGCEGLGEDIAVFMRPEVLAKANMLARESGDVECGGVLIGRLCRPPEVPAPPEVQSTDTQHSKGIFMEITDQIMADNVESDKTKLTFTHETWNGILQQVESRNSDECILGWWHKHPNWCGQCPQEKKSACKVNSVFFSDDDRSLHGLVFGRAYHVALLLSERDNGMITSMYGWRKGRIQPRNFHLLNANDRPGV